MTTPFSITYPSVESALSALGEKVFGASITIATKDVPCKNMDGPFIPALRPGWFFYGKGELLHPSDDLEKDIARFTSDWNDWDYSGWSGKLKTGYYAIKAGTELARLNGLEPMVETPQTKPIPSGLPAIPEEWVYIGTDSEIDTGRMENREGIEAWQNDIMWHDARTNKGHWRNDCLARVSKQFDHWHAIAKKGSELARLNAYRYTQPAPEVDWKFIADQRLVELRNLRDEVNDLESKLTIAKNLLEKIGKTASAREF